MAEDFTHSALTWQWQWHIYGFRKVSFIIKKKYHSHIKKHHKNRI
jgi:hypothetical protein